MKYAKPLDALAQTGLHPTADPGQGKATSVVVGFSMQVITMAQMTCHTILRGRGSSCGPANSLVRTKWGSTFKENRFSGKRTTAAPMAAHGCMSEAHGDIHWIEELPHKYRNALHPARTHADATDKVVSDLLDHDITMDMVDLNEEASLDFLECGAPNEAGEDVGCGHPLSCGFVGGVIVREGEGVATGEAGRANIPPKVWTSMWRSLKLEEHGMMSDPTLPPIFGPMSLTPSVEDRETFLLYL